MKQQNLIKSTVLAILIMIALTPANAQLGKLKSLRKKARKTIENTQGKVDKAQKQVYDTTNKVTGKKKQKSAWGKSYDERYPQEETSSQSNANGGPTQADLAKMNDNIDNILFDYSYIFTAKKMDDGKLYLVLFHSQDKTTTFDSEQLKKIVAARDGVAILEQYNFTGITKEELEKKKKTIADLIVGYNNSVKQENEEANNELKWESHKSQASGLANALARTKKAIAKQFASTIKTLDIAMEDEWSLKSFKDGIYRMKRKTLFGLGLFYDTKTKEYFRMQIQVSDLWYIDHPNDVEKSEHFNYKKLLKKDQHVPQQFWQ